MRNAQTTRSRLSLVVRLLVLCALCCGAIVVSLCLAADKPAGPASPDSAPGTGSRAHGPVSSASAPGPGQVASAPASRPIDPKEAPNDPNVDLLVKGLNEFAIDLYKEIAKTEKGNIFFSPFSISSALTMVYAGARGKTAEEMAKVLHFPPELLKNNAMSLHAAASKLLRYLDAEVTYYGGKRGFKLCVANALWVQKGHPFIGDFTEVCRSGYASELREFDFLDGDETSRKAVNAWVEKQTEQRIKELMRPGSVNETTRMIATNATYFRARWRLPFKREKTQDGPFWTSPDTKVTVPMMHNRAQFRFGRIGTFKVVRLDYVGWDVCAIILLPDSKDGLEALEKSLTGEIFLKCHNSIDDADVDVCIPKFRMTWGSDLKPIRSLGMVRALTPGQADFSGITGDMSLALSSLLHKAIVDLNEEGTEAGRGVGGAMDAVIMERKEFIADYPFLIMIADRPTGCIYFLGRVIDPTQTTGGNPIEENPRT